MKSFFTSESVSCGHPDKLCDQIADRLLDAILKQDMKARVACEVTCAVQQIHIFGEITTTASVDYVQIARQAVREIGYTQPERGFDADHCAITVDVHPQSPDIAMGIDRKAEVMDSGAGDQGTAFGFACTESENLMPLPIELAHALARRMDYVRKAGELPFLMPDGKTQVTVEYEQGIPKRAATVVVSCQQREDMDIDQLRSEVYNHMVLPTIVGKYIDEETQFYINPAGRFVIGGPAGDTGLTGRKVLVDTYGGYARNGGALCGKDPTKVDRSGAYMARYLAKNIVAAKLASKCEVQLSYAIGLADPVAVDVNTFGTEVVAAGVLQEAVESMFDLRPAAIIQKFHLQRPIYAPLACYGQFGSNAITAPWEQTDAASALCVFVGRRRGSISHR